MHNDFFPSSTDHAFCDRTIRKWLALAFVGALTLLIYASLVPLQYQALSWQEAVDIFTQTPWLNLRLYNRADWAANFLVVIPVGWLGAGAIDWGRKSRHAILMMLPVLIALLCSVVIGIEFVQSWFPIRTQSVNDILAGCLGAITGPILWLLIGRSLLTVTLKAFAPGDVKKKLWHASITFMMLNVAYAMIPLDLVLNAEELEQKIAIGRIEFLPESFSIRSLVKPVTLAILRAAPITLMLCIAKQRSTAVWITLCFVTACELIQVPVFSRTASIFDLLISGFGIAIALAIYSAKRELAPFLRSPLFWLTIAVVSVAALIFSLVLTSNSVVRSPIELTERWRGFFSWPLVSYYYQPELAALTTIVYKLIAFSWLGICVGLAISNCPPDHLPVLRSSATLLLICGSVGFEVAQIFLAPHIGDAFDALWYFGTSYASCRITIAFANSFIVPNR